MNLLLGLALLLAPQDARDGLVDALNASIDEGGITLQGRVAREMDMPEGGDDMPPMGEDMVRKDKHYTGSFEGSVDAEGRLHVTAAKKGKGSIELFGKGSRQVKRSTWTGDTIAVDGFAKEVLPLIRLKALLGAVKESKSVKQLDGSKVGSTPCRVYTASLKTTLITGTKTEGEHRGPMMMSSGNPWKLKAVEGTFWVSEETGRLVRVRATLMHKMEMHMGGMGGDYGGEDEYEDEDEDEEGEAEACCEMHEMMQQMKLKRTYTITVKAYDKSLIVKLPREVDDLMSR